MDNNIQVAAVYVDGSVRIYGPAPKTGPRQFVEALQFSSYGAALIFAQEFEQKERDEELKRRKR